MSKKKATMTLKDFHGGSIPSDLPLPSAPGVYSSSAGTVRPTDRGGFDRQMSWGNSMGRSEPRLRPASAGSARNLDDKTPFLNHSPFIGRNFDEDERKPLDGVSGPRRTVNDDTFRAQSPRVVESKIDTLSGARVNNRAVSVSVSQISSGSPGSSYGGLNNQTLSGTRSYGSNYPNTGGNVGHAVSGSYTNAWGIRKETASMKEPVSAPWSAPDAETKLAHASALEKVSSGRWNSKHVHPQKDAEAFGIVEYNKTNYNRLDVGPETEHHDVALMMHAERSLTVDDGIHGGRTDLPTCERVKPTHPIESYQRNSPVTTDAFQSFRPKSGGPEFQTALPSESSERPKLKLLPRSKPLENFEPSVVDYKQGHQQTTDILYVEDSYGLNETSNHVQSGSAGSVVGDQAPGRPKLNLKPRSQPLEQLEGKGEVKSGFIMHANISGEQKIAKLIQRRDHQTWRNNREVEKHRNQPHDRPPSPETWRKPAEHTKPVRYGKAASAVELAQAFSKSVSDPTLVSGPRGLPGRGQMPFSRLTSPSPRPQINGY